MFELNIKESESGATVEVNGEIDGINDSLEIKDAITRICEKNPSIKMSIFIKSSKIIPSTLLGYLLKLAHDKKDSFELEINSEPVYDLLNKMMLVEILNAKLVKR